MLGASGQIYVAATSTGPWGDGVPPFSGTGSGFVADLDATGALVWNGFVPGSVWDITIDGSGALYLTGQGSTSFGSPVRPYTGNQDGFVVKMADVGVLDTPTPTQTSPPTSTRTQTSTRTPTATPTKSSIWTGAVDNLWSNPGNWGGRLPVAEDTLIFPAGAQHLTNINDLPVNTTFSSIVLNGGNYDLGGNQIGLRNGISGNGANNTIDLPLQLLGTQAINGTGLVVNGPINLGTSSLTASGQYNGVISGTGSVSAVGTTVLTANNTYSGQTSVYGATEIDGVQPASAVQVANSGRLSGSGTLARSISTGADA